ncbi:FAD-dependent oxidoreductase [Clostridiales Family XIII bacterium ASD5510]|uniref:FAD-dependent oxidoreductase n=1 Tax=Hominibacterium faecale TaxID=2839743 RepID=A0A9J6QU92_9FIRM|nr:FAD-dependent oxidoreductase [Hominibacterium faecale]MCU7377182.1 FAD-dependent oxidoreductase [Hominibacterium faecale]
MKDYKLKFPKLFEPLKVGNVVYRNRLFASPSMMSQVIDGGKPTDALIGYYREKAKGGAAQVTVGDTPVDQEHALAFPGLCLIKPNMPFLAELAFNIEAYGAVPSFELNHAGWMANPELSGSSPISSISFMRGDGVQVIQMDEDMMKRVADNFAKSAAFIKKCGFKAAVLHGGHGWLLAQFLSPMVNRRTDEYGGNEENRARFPKMVIDAVRKAVGKDFILEYRISGTEYDPAGLTLNETIPFVRSIQDKIDLVHVSGGIDTRLDLTLKAHPGIFQEHGCNVFLAEAMKKSVDIPVVTVGAISSPQMAEEVLAAEKADVVAMCRALIADPYFPVKARRNLDDEISPCTRCLHCRGHMDTHKHFSCSVNPRTGRENRYPAEVPSAPKSKRIVVLGGGPAGMKAAINAKKRGHEVILADNRAKLGGQLNFTDFDAHKSDLRAQKNHLAYMVQKLGVDIRLNTQADRAYISGLKPDVLFVAAGAVPIIPKIKGINGSKVMGAIDTYYKMEKVGAKVVIIGGGLVGVETALFLADKGKDVTIIEMTSTAFADANRLHAEEIRLAVKEHNVKILTETACISINGEGVIVETGGERKLIKADTVVYSVGMQSNTAAYAELYDAAPEVYRIGDCAKVGTTGTAIQQAYVQSLEV